MASPVFSVLDLSGAFNQLFLDEKSAKIPIESKVQIPVSDVVKQTVPKNEVLQEPKVVETENVQVPVRSPVPAVVPLRRSNRTVKPPERLDL